MPELMKWLLTCCGQAVDLTDLDDMPNEDGSRNYRGICLTCEAQYNITVLRPEGAQPP
jgi:hypothetical protein